MPDMTIHISIQTEESEEAQRYEGGDVSDAQAFTAGVTGSMTIVQAAMSCTTTEGEGRSFNRICQNGEECNALLDDIDAWLTENAAYE